MLIASLFVHSAASVTMTSVSFSNLIVSAAVTNTPFVSLTGVDVTIPITTGGGGSAFYFDSVARVVMKKCLIVSSYPNPIPSGYAQQPSGIIAYGVSSFDISSTNLFNVYGFGFYGMGAKQNGVININQVMVYNSSTSLTVYNAGPTTINIANSVFDTAANDHITMFQLHNDDNLLVTLNITNSIISNAGGLSNIPCPTWRQCAGVHSQSTAIISVANTNFVNNLNGAILVSPDQPSSKNSAVILQGNNFQHNQLAWNVTSFNVQEEMNMCSNNQFAAETNCLGGSCQLQAVCQ